MKAFEENISFEKMIQYSEPYLGKKSFWAAWLQDIISALMSRQSPYRYITRVVLAQKRLQNISDEHMHASQLMLETVVFNIAPLISNSATDSSKLFDDGDGPYGGGFEPLDDISVRGVPAAITARYKTLEEAIGRYVEIGLAVISHHMGEEEFPDFEAGVTELRGKISEFEQQLSDARKKLYVDFPVEDLTSISDFVIHEERRIEKSDALSPPVQVELQKAVANAENRLIVFTNSLINKARAVFDQLKAANDKYLRQIARIQVIWDLLKEKIDEEGRAATEAQIIAVRKSITEAFSAESHLPENLVKRLEKEYSIAGKK